MTDREEVVAFLTKFGIPHGTYRTDIEPHKAKYVTPEKARVIRIGRDVIYEDDWMTITPGTVQVDGYPGFSCDFDFNADGSLKGIGVWE